jgi:hypothetical protein
MEIVTNAVRRRSIPVKNKTLDDTLSMIRSKASAAECIPFRINIIPTARANYAIARTNFF